MFADLVRITTRDGIQLDGVLRRAEGALQLPIDAVCMVHGTGGNFYSSTLFDFFTDRLLELGCPVARVNTRGHDGISTAVSSKGGVRLGAAYEVLDDCRHDITGWLDWLKENVGPRVCMLGHSSGAVKVLYAAAHEPQHAPASIIALSPPRLSYSWFCSTPRRDEFLGIYQQAEQLCAAGKPTALIDVTLPLPMAIAAGSYVEKYGTDERYNYVNFLAGVPCPTLVLFGSVEVDKNIAFSGGPEAVTDVGRKRTRLQAAVVDGADHFYTGVRQAAWQSVLGWLHGEGRA